MTKPVSFRPSSTFFLSFRPSPRVEESQCSVWDLSNRRGLLPRDDKVRARDDKTRVIPTGTKFRFREVEESRDYARDLSTPRRLVARDDDCVNFLNYTKSSYKSFHSGFIFSIRKSFLLLFHFLICFSLSSAE